MILHLPNIWVLFTITFGILLSATFILRRQGLHFYTMAKVVRKFNMLDLQFAATEKELVNIISGIYDLPVNDNIKSSIPKSSTVLNKLKEQIWVDFIVFIPAFYSTIFLLCMKLTYKMYSFDQGVFHYISFIFYSFALLQVIALILDTIENIYLLHTIHNVENKKKDVNFKPSPLFPYSGFKLLEVFKWGFALTAAVCAISATLYFWLSGFYSEGSIPYFCIVLVEIILFAVATVISPKVNKHSNISSEY